MTEEKKNRVQERLMEVLRDASYLDEDKENGIFTYEFFPDQGDRLSDTTVCNILLEKDIELAFVETVEALYDEHRDCVFSEYIHAAMDDLYPKDREEKEEMKQYLYELLTELISFEYPFAHYKEQEYCVDLMIDTGDANAVYESNSVYPGPYGIKGDGIDKEASLVWLAKTQGFTKTQLEQALYKGDVAAPVGFLESVRQEVANETSGSNCLTFLVKMVLSDLVKLNELIQLQEPNGEKLYHADARPDCGAVTISKEAQPGLYDPWNGAGSVFEIQLEKDIELPIKYIRSCLPDRYFTWSVYAVYNIPDSAWEDVVTEIRAAS